MANWWVFTSDRMKWTLLIIFAFFEGECLNIFEDSKYELLSLLTERTRFIREIGGMGSKLPHIERAVKRTCENEEKLESTIDAMKSCLKAKKMFQTERDEYIEHINHCSKETREMLKKCLPEKLKYFPDFLIKLVDSVVRLLYDDFAQIIRGLSPCLSKLRETDSQEDYHSCIARLADTNNDQIPESKKKFCDKFIPISECFVKQINDTCTMNEDLEKFTKDYMKAVQRPCN